MGRLYFPLHMQYPFRVSLPLTSLPELGVQQYMNPDIVDIGDRWFNLMSYVSDPVIHAEIPNVTNVYYEPPTSTQQIAIPRRCPRCGINMRNL
ncbi:hypothetical protein K0M31_014834 [Melipona bicolor]|uniref:Uncharacterized protein n=1 Tax=Melipona bicolor TaxID=60889 RepID=A0AA40KFM8_9HYME|nr:hypothetical protein K0M31_014834 [Melipona bicolor]